MTDKPQNAQTPQSSPEKKLLKIIENSGGKADAKETVKSAAVRPLKRPELPAFLKKLKFSFPSGGRKPAAKFHPGSVMSADFRKVNGVLVVCTLITLVYFLLSIGMYKKDAAKDIRSVLFEKGAHDVAASMPKVIVSMSETSTLENLLDKIKKRDFFKPVATQAKKAPAEKAVLLSSQAIEQATANMRLVGISYASAAEDSYAMIEDAETKITYFAKEGQLVMGVKVVAIGKDKVILGMNDMQKELR